MKESTHVKEAYNYLKYRKIVANIQDLANKMGAQRTNVSAALNGSELYLTPSFCKRFNQAFDEIFDEVWLLTGEGSMLKEIHEDESNAIKKKEKIIDRFSKYMKTKGLNDNKVTIEVDLSVGTLGKSRKENRDLSAKNVEKILNYYQDLNRVWLLTGEGSMFKETAQADNNATFVAPYITEELVYLPLITTSAVASFIENLQDATEEMDTYPIYVAKGETFDKDKHVIVEVKGESMYPTITNKSMILCEKIKPTQWGNVPNETIVAIVYKDIFTIKRVLRNDLTTNNSLQLSADNQKYGTTTIQLCEIRAIFKAIKKVSEYFV